MQSTDPAARFVSYAQNQEDVLLHRALRTVGKGFYVDVGAQNPVEDSVTKAFYDAGWSGINVEPSPAWYQSLQNSRPRDINVNCAAHSVCTELEFFHLPHTGLSTCKREIALEQAAAWNIQALAMRVNARTLADILAEYGVGEIHFLKIDAEGSEANVLSGMDFGRWRPWIVLVEAIHPVTHEATHEQWEATLLSAAYSFAFFDGVNRYYLADERQPLNIHFAAPACSRDHFVRHRELLASARGKARTDAESKLELPAGFGVNLIGQFTSSTGLGIGARHLAHSLLRRGVPIALFDDPPSYGHAHEGDVRLADLIRSSPDQLPHPVNLYITYAGGIEAYQEKYPGLMRAGRFHAAVIWWETTALPNDWKVTLSRLDAIVAFSGFIHQSMANLIPLTSILEGKQPFETPQPTAFKRADLGLPEEATLFIGSFDPQGDPARKNPAAMPFAFRRAFPLRTENACLLVRVNHADASRFGSAALEQMRVAAEDDPRIGFLQGKMSQAQLHGLFRCADAYVSLHRAEGLGFGMLEAMALAKPVIATAWSGNTSFMSSTSGCMVRYRPVPICGNYESYRPETLGQGAIWAEPVIEDAAAWMQALHADPELRRRIGGNARAQFLRYQQAADELVWVQELAGHWQTRNLLPGVLGKFSSGVPR